MLRPKLVFVIFFLFLSARSLAQETFIIEGDTLQLQREVNGTLSLFYSEKGRSFRYFVQKGNRMSELKNERVDGIPEYKLQLEEFSSDTEISVADVKFELYSLKHFTNLYNAKVQQDYQYNAASDNVRKRFGFFTGISNNTYTDNPENILVPVIGLEFELYDPNLAPRHSAFIHLRQSFKREVYRSTSTQLSLNYRFKALRFRHFNIHVNTELVNFMYSRDQNALENEAGEVIDFEQESGFAFNVPLSFGIGSDIQITENSYITVSYNNFVSIILESNEHFPVDFTLGYKYNL